MDSAQRFNEISKYKQIGNYLEIGVQRGITYHGLNFPQKVGVDPNFMFDHTVHQSANSRLYRTTSDDYFINLAGDSIFDFIFLDGLHTHEQTLRDFLNALAHSHAKTIFVMDDVFPCDVYSSLRSNGIQQRLKAQPNTDNYSWHGDVYKTLFFIHDFMPNYSYLTTDPKDGNSQAFIYRLPRPAHKPRFDNLERISRLDYFEFLDNRDLLNLQNEQEIIKTVGRFLTA